VSGAEFILNERRRQIREEGWTPEHDDCHREDELTAAAACYLYAGSRLPKPLRHPWPWPTGFKPSDRVRNLVKAGALIAAEIDRLIRFEREGDVVVERSVSGAVLQRREKESS